MQAYQTGGFYFYSVQPEEIKGVLSGKTSMFMDGEDLVS